MNIAVLPAFAGGVLDGVANALQVAPLSEWPAELVDQAVQSTRVSTRGLRLMRVALEQAVSGGMPAHFALTTGVQLLTITDKHSDKYIAMADQLRKLRVTSADLPAEVNDLIAAFLEILAEFDALRRLMAPIVAKAKAALSPIDEARLEAGREAVRQGDSRVYADAEEMARDLGGRLREPCMAYSIQFTGPVRRYLSGLRLTRNELVKLYTNLHAQLAIVPDAFRADPANRLTPGGPEFVWTLIMPADDGRVFVFRFIVDDSAAQYGLLQLVYADMS